jgi:hypothetical protein
VFRMVVRMSSSYYLHSIDRYLEWKRSLFSVMWGQDIYSLVKKIMGSGFVLR